MNSISTSKSMFGAFRRGGVQLSCFHFCGLSFSWVIPLFPLIPGRWASNAKLPSPPHCILMLLCAWRLRDTYHILHHHELRGGEIPGVMWERAGLGMQLGLRTILLAHFLLWLSIRGCSSKGELVSCRPGSLWLLYSLSGRSIGGSSLVSGHLVTGWPWESSRKVSQGQGIVKPPLSTESHAVMLHLE